MNVLGKIFFPFILTLISKFQFCFGPNATSLGSKTIALNCLQIKCPVTVTAISFQHERKERKKYDQRPLIGASRQHFFFSWPETSGPRLLYTAAQH